ncbi:hypothetical protein D3C80_1479620 [compost metagenome]
MELTYSENEVCGNIRASIRTPMMPSSDNSGEPCHGLGKSKALAAAGAVGGALFTGGTSGSVIAATIVHTAHSAEAMMLIQKKVAWSRISPPTMAPSSDPTLVDICKMANSLARREGASMLTPYAWAGAM